MGSYELNEAKIKIARLEGRIEKLQPAAKAMKEVSKGFGGLYKNGAGAAEQLKPFFSSCVLAELGILAEARSKKHKEVSISYYKDANDMHFDDCHKCGEPGDVMKCNYPKCRLSTTLHALALFGPLRATFTAAA